MRMDRVGFFVLAAFTSVSVMWSRGSAQSLSPDSECTNSLLSLINCEPFLSGNNVTIPPDSCCAGLNDLVKSAPSCLCGVIAGNPLFSSINLTRALQLPLKCGIPIDRSQCSGVVAPPPSLPHRASSSQDILAPPSTGLRTSGPLWLWAQIGGAALLSACF